MLVVALAATAVTSFTLVSQASAAPPSGLFRAAPAGPASPELAPNDPAIRYSFTRVITDGLSNPVFITHADDQRLFVVEQDGRVRTWLNGTLAITPFLSIEPVVNCCGERGLLGLAFEPNFANTGRFYVYYTNNNGDENIARYTRSLTDTSIANSLSATILITVPHPDQANHNGGWLGFGPDGFLYAATGDGGGGGDPFCAAQNASELRGKMLRLNVVNQVRYTSPTTNTFAITATTKIPEVWALGLRNPWRNSFDRQTGQLYIADVGQGAWEEVNAVPAGASAGLNFGWSQREGRHNYSSGCAPSGIAQTEPFFDYDHSATGGQSVTGGYVYRGPSYPWLNGVYFFADFVSGRIWASTSLTTTGVYNTVEITNTNFGISTFGEDVAGELYFADYDNSDIYRINSVLSSNEATPTPTKTSTPSQTSTATTTPGPLVPRSFMPIIMAFYQPPATPTATVTQTPTATTTATKTATPTKTATATATITNRATSTSTATPTTSAATNTAIATATTANEATSTSTATATPTTSIATNTATPTATATESLSSTATGTATATPTDASTTTPTPTSAVVCLLNSVSC